MKYRQRGYRDTERSSDKERRTPQEPRPPQDRSLRHMMERSAKLIIRCHQCSADAGPIETLTPQSMCAQCGAALHCCRNCASFDTGARWECREPIEQAVPDKTAANECALFKPNTVLDATGRRSGSPSSGGGDARAAFDALFKKS